MIKNIIKVLAAIVVGYILGVVIGLIAGAIIGVIMSIFFREIVSSNLTIWMSVFMAVVLGGTLSYIGTEAGIKTFETPHNSRLGIVFGSVFGLIFLSYYKVIYIPNTVTFDQGFYMAPILYGIALGQNLGSIIFPLIGVRGVIHEAAETRKRIKANEESKNELSFYKSSKTEEYK